VAPDHGAQLIYDVWQNGKQSKEESDQEAVKLMEDAHIDELIDSYMKVRIALQNFQKSMLIMKDYDRWVELFCLKFPQFLEKIGENE
jgi:hypothetical protein